MKWVIFLFCVMLWDTCVHAAVMCMPDNGLSMCESCSNFQEIGTTGIWYASCCGVDVYGLYLPIKTYGFSETRSVSVIKIGDADISDMAVALNRNFCLMLSPVIPPYMVQVSYDISYSVSECSNFIPRCAMTYCDEVVEADAGAFL